MKITFLGVGSAFTTAQYYQSNLLLTTRAGKNLLIDCGSDIRFALAEYRARRQQPTGDGIDAVYITHLHADHIGGLEWLAITSYFANPRRRPTLHCEADLQAALWEHSLRGGLACIQEKDMELADYFEPRPVGTEGSFLWEETSFQLLKHPHVAAPIHVLDSFGLAMKPCNNEGGTTVLFTGDTQFRPDHIIPLARKTAIIFHDCETTPYKTKVHAHYEELRTLPAAIRGKMWLYGYQPDPPYSPREDGFLGFVTKGQEFDLAVCGW